MDQSDQATRAAARDLIGKTRARITPARVDILATLLGAQRPLSHLDIQQLLEPSLDRVTVYRVLDWLTAENLAHKLSGDDRVWRFSAAKAPHHHAHFHCQQCGRFYCLEDITTDLPMALPKLFSADSVEITVKGICASCKTA
ncbi:transcriptional repressor [Chitinibacter fontanus]|uniref:Transcriptional repressor n=1 Tax=Chitinibacter fontanus TaxID=1737446 RepID=A0A7D5ZC82_9NEIS|nr:transcriptional repressor [Chitinibacter fontanus]QLI81505.1 transcriptional repressor [Chitinibacter fontanus]